MISVRPSYDSYLDEYYGLSTDTKPASGNVVNGSTFVEIDTNKKYRYDAENKVWNERAAGGIVTPVSSTAIVPCSLLEDQVSGTQTVRIDVKAGELFELIQNKRVLVDAGCVFSSSAQAEVYLLITMAGSKQVQGETGFLFYLPSFPDDFFAPGENEYPSWTVNAGSGDPVAPAVPGNQGEYIAQ